MVLNPAAYQGIDHHSAKADTGVDDAQHQALALDEPVVDDGVIGAESTDGMGDAVDHRANDDERHPGGLGEDQIGGYREDAAHHHQLFYPELSHKTSIEEPTEGFGEERCGEQREIHGSAGDAKGLGHRRDIKGHGVIPHGVDGEGQHDAASRHHPTVKELSLCQH